MNVKKEGKTKEKKTTLKEMIVMEVMMKNPL